MSAVIIKWRSIAGTHASLLLSNVTLAQFPDLQSVKTKSSDLVYISIYMPGPKKGVRFASQLLYQDQQDAQPLGYITLPTLEDGNLTGLSEHLMAKYWQEIYKLKKIPHEVVINEFKENKPKIDVSGKFRMFHPLNLNCAEFIGHILEKGGATIFKSRKPNESFTERYFEQLDLAVKKFFKDHDIPLKLHPVAIKANPNVAGELAEAKAQHMSFFRI